jgi:hypothetical protein
MVEPFWGMTIMVCCPQTVSDGIFRQDGRSGNGGNGGKEGKEEKAGRTV